MCGEGAPPAAPSARTRREHPLSCEVEGRAPSSFGQCSPTLLPRPGLQREHGLAARELSGEWLPCLGVGMRHLEPHVGGTHSSTPTHLFIFSSAKGRRRLLCAQSRDHIPLCRWPVPPTDPCWVPELAGSSGQIQAPQKGPTSSFSRGGLQRHWLLASRMGKLRQRA